MSYIMESEAETRRLLLQEQADDARALLLATGLTPGARALDAGCGPGGISRTMARIVGGEGSVLGMDLSDVRLAEAIQRCAGLPQARFIRGDIRRTGLPDAAFDYTWSQYVLEYLSDRDAALAELIRVTRPGGRVVVSEIDGQGLNNWPLPAGLEEGARCFERGLASQGFDLFVGRKLFQSFRRAGLRDIRVHVTPQYVVAGTADDRFLADWETRFAALAPVVTPAFGSEVAYGEFCQAYLRMLRDPDTLKYSVLVVTEGVRA
ncbi:methyltransferase domain-containing protein [Myxococcus sp. CA051A]|nr:MULTISPECIES: methyltransferase domain-containing protein [Myxococcus]NTX04123.1 methyltransferase domain-containing protein [Myxococcus sp. CA040A]NTX13269.1 methyltransferase domain-containing protein [Myxococcus sp. CA056]NTX36279.1 methyltransferase domain-containing protein [Myxococcus sp. CA033]NTX55395.1 methyltransferase domain-containing protein [Myxococcus sp. CA039A]NTX61729.1 methyltransferase domain-containing protein [Myxococcus sp. CA051A]